MARKAKSKTAVISADEVFKKMQRAAFSVDFLQNPESALTLYKLADEEGRKLNEKALETYNALFVERVEKKTTERTGLTIEQLRHPETLTPEQRETAWLTSVIIRDEIETERRQSYLQSYFYSALTMLEAFKIKSYASDEEAAIKEVMAIYFLTLHDMEPTAPGALTDEQAAELAALMQRLDDYFLEADSESNEGSGVFEILHKFVELNSPNKNLPKIYSMRLKDTIYPLDKISEKFCALEPGDNLLKAEKDSDSRKGKTADIYVMLDFENNSSITTSQALTPFDKGVFIAVANLKEQGHDTVTTAQIYSAMGNRSRPSADLRRKILESVEKMSACRVTLDNSQEAKIYKYRKYQSVRFNLLQTITKTEACTENGQIVNDAIIIEKLPILFEFAKERHQITHVPLAVLECPISQTDDNLSLIYYLLTRICHMKRDIKKRKKNVITKILLETLYKECNITDRKQRSRTTGKDGKVNRILKSFKEKGLIKGYHLTKDNIEIEL